MAGTRKIRLGDVEIGGGAPLTLLGGPCVIESEEHAGRMAEELKRITGRLGVPFVFKSSYDKANRSSIGNYRGPGLAAGLEILTRIRKRVGVPILSDVHGLEEMRPAAETLDVIQIPAFLCRQTDILVAAGRTGKPVNLKKGQFMAPWDMANAVEKIASSGNRDIVITERGVSFGYNTLVADMRSLPAMRGLGYPVIFDATHSAQAPAGRGASSGGDRDMARVLARAATAAGIDGIFLEIHDDPDKALCDGPNMIPLAEVEDLLASLLEIDRAARRDMALAEERKGS